MFPTLLAPGSTGGPNRSQKHCQATIDTPVISHCRNIPVRNALRPARPTVWRPRAGWAFTSPRFAQRFARACALVEVSVGQAANVNPSTCVHPSAQSKHRVYVQWSCGMRYRFFRLPYTFPRRIAREILAKTSLASIPQIREWTMAQRHQPNRKQTGVHDLRPSDVQMRKLLQIFNCANE
jgi:hypothetical protein